MPSLGKHDPLSQRQADKSLINQTRDRLDNEPVLVSGVLIQCNDESLHRLRETIEFFDDLKQDDGTVSWKLADNGLLPCNREELQTLMIETRKARALRFSRLHARANEFKQQIDSGQTVTLRDIAGSW
ncbi:DUF4376 domain-containing protein [Endozoicomonas gorgoniicola]|uniref:DUF4376 domain-containing protein n=1 Tax=Endozoicomonas gorgoniicola TaxID=1234144 RepID=A0ABT3MNX4_9GAMM|nr:DUF4376 domain-containing protein [Endozoicomonas gorgoniicola]MCW7551070.1 DUF4376 domain-containing protein [Endozoicomonas gorgoniicola]MCW7556478.1 DUF4376 domain-containing protein [Endozoicomonas gorgoniicola]